MTINKYLPFALIYFFLNSLGLPFGLTWMALLGPVFYVWVLLKRKKEILFPFLFLLLPFLFMHIIVIGVELNVYLISLLNLVLVYLFCQAAYTFFKVCEDPEPIFRKILYINFFFCLIGIVFYFTPWDHVFWITQVFTKGVNDFRRFKLFTYEASYYATLFMPIFLFYLLQYIFKQNKIASWKLLPMIFLPYILSFSIGAIAAAILAGVLTSLVHYRTLLVKRRVVNAFIYLSTMLAAGMFILVVYFRHNPIFTRLLNIFSGSDTSAQGRTEDAFILAQRMLEQKNEWWGIGLGQVKLVGHDIVGDYYLYNMEYVATIPNAMAETLAIFGWLGFFLKLIIEIALFFITKVWTNYYRLILFFFIFIYQFTGSFITNMAEYMIWILAFTNVFRQFDHKSQPALTASSISAS